MVYNNTCIRISGRDRSIMNGCLLGEQCTLSVVSLLSSKGIFMNPHILHWATILHDIYKFGPNRRTKKCTLVEEGSTLSAVSHHSFKSFS